MSVAQSSGNGGGVRPTLCPNGQSAGLCMYIRRIPEYQVAFLNIMCITTLPCLCKVLCMSKSQEFYTQYIGTNNVTCLQSNSCNVDKFSTPELLHHATLGLFRWLHSLRSVWRSGVPAHFHVEMCYEPVFVSHMGDCRNQTITIGY